jgi:pimeloyl-ACP methyl ester carboxylesterase
LPAAGWATLSLQLPVLPDAARLEEYLAVFPEAAPRIAAAIQYLQQQGILNIALAGHGLGAAMGTQFLAAGAAGTEQVRAFVGIGMSALPGTAAHTPEHLAKIRVPVLDLYGTRDPAPVLSAGERAAAARAAGNGGYRQTEVMGADHSFRGLNETLVVQVSRWLTRAAPSATLTPDSPGAAGR